MYKMTTRPIDKPWYRGNLNLEFHNFSVMRTIPSPMQCGRKYSLQNLLPMYDTDQFRFNPLIYNSVSHATLMVLIMMGGAFFMEVFPINAVQGDEVVDERLGNPRIVVERFFEERKNKQGE